MRVIGTAGHVDHGKSSLIEALTGTHPDRLREEQVREMTIDLGFGWLTLPDGQEVGIVDVPGHRDFLENMLAGIAGIDAVLLVVAVDEGIMPQTREHIAILDVLQIRTGIIVLTKLDLIADDGWIAAVEDDVRRALRGTGLQDAPIQRVSARSRSGLTELVETLCRVLKDQPERVDLGRPRLPIDRVFSMSGFGTVVTGTLSNGHLMTGDEVEFLPSGLRGRVRGLQTHRKQVERALPGSRTAVNISGVSAEQLQRGEVLSHPASYPISKRLDARFRLLPEASSSLFHNREVKFFTGTTETLATLRLLGAEELAPGEEGWIQLELQHPLVCVRGDAFVLRRPSPAETLGGGIVVDAQPEGRHRRFDGKLLSKLDALAHGSPVDVLLEVALALHAAPIMDLILRSQLAAVPAAAALSELLRTGRLIVLEEGEPRSDSHLLAIAQTDWEALREEMTRIVSGFHAKYPLRKGIPREELKSQLDLSPRVFGAVIARGLSDEVLVETGNAIARRGFSIQFEPHELAKVDALMRDFERSPFSPPGTKACKSATGEEVFGALLALGELVAVSDEVVFRKIDYDSMVRKVRGTLAERGEVTLAQVRDLFQTSRKYAQALLEHLDVVGVTKRSGDYRIPAA